MKKDIFVSKEINNVIDALATPINISSIVENSGVTTITTETIRLFDNLSITMDLKEGMIVSIGEINYPVQNVIHTPQFDSFDVVGTGITASTWNVAAKFEVASRFEINQILQQESGQLNRFPLIWLLPVGALDKDNVVIDFQSPITMVFAHKANKTDRTSNRIDNNFELIIQPLVTLFNLWLKSSDFNYMLEYNGQGKSIDYDLSNFPFYGSPDKTKQVLNTTTDAIEVSYDLKFKKQY